MVGRDLRNGRQVRPGHDSESCIGWVDWLVDFGAVVPDSHIDRMRPRLSDLVILQDEVLYFI